MTSARSRSRPGTWVLAGVTLACCLFSVCGALAAGHPAEPTAAPAAVSPRLVLPAASRHTASSLVLTVALVRGAPAPLRRTPTLAEAATPGYPEALGCLPWDVSCLVDSWFSSLVVAAIHPLLTLAGQTELSTDDYTGLPAVEGMWAGMLGVSDTLFVLLICAGGVILLGYHTYQGSYTLKEVAPRFAIAMAVSSSSLLLTAKAISLSNGISAAVPGGALPATATSTLTQMLMQGAQGGTMLILLVLTAVIVAIIIAITYVLRQMALVLLIAMAPLALSGYALPQTSWAARWW